MRRDSWSGRVRIGVIVGLALVIGLAGCARTPEAVAPQKPSVTATPVEAPAPKTETFFLAAHDFRDGLAWVQPERSGETDPAWDCIDTTGKVVFSLSQGEEPLTDFARGSAVVGFSGADGKTACKLVDATGKTIFPKGGDAAEYRFEISLRGYTFVQLTIDEPDHFENRMGILDSTGAWTLEPVAVEGRDPFSVDHSEPLYAQYGLLQVDGYKKYDFFDAEKGVFVVFPAPDNDHDNRFDKQVIRYLFDRIFENGPVFAAVHANIVNSVHPNTDDGFELSLIGFKRELPLDVNGKGNWDGYGAFYDRDKKMAINMQDYSDANESYAVGGFSGGYCSLQIVNGGGSRYVTIIDKTGKKMFEPIPGVEIEQYSGERALYKESKDDEDYSYIDLAGNKVISGVKEGSAFDGNGLARVVLTSEQQMVDPMMGTYSHRQCFIDRDGNVAF